MDDVCDTCSEEDDGKTVIVFNTQDNVILNRTSDGRGFGPSVIAPFSRVEVLGETGHVDGFIVAKSFVTTGSEATSLRLHGDAYMGAWECPTDEPTSQPTPFSASTTTNDFKSGSNGDPHCKQNDCAVFRLS